MTKNNEQSPITPRYHVWFEGGGIYSVLDTSSNKPAQKDGEPLVNLTFERATELAKDLNA
jgi:hypothetical protein